MFFTHRKVFTHDASKLVYTVIDGETPVGQVCGSKGRWQVLGPSDLAPEVYPTRDAAGATLIAQRAAPSPRPLTTRDAGNQRKAWEARAWGGLESRASQILTGF